MALSEKRRELILDLSLGIIFPIIVTFILLLPLYIKPGFIFHGDAGWYMYARIPVILEQMIFTWHEGPLSSNGFFFLALELALLAFGSYFANHAMVFILAFLPGVTSYFSIRKTLNLIYGDQSIIFVQISAVIGSIFYLVNWQNYGLTSPTLSWSLSYIILPVLTYFIIKIYKERKFQDIFFFALISMLGDTVPDWVVFLFIETLILLIAIIIFSVSDFRKFLRYILTTVYLVIVTLVANAYMLVEIIGGFTFGVGGAFATYGTPSSEILAAKGESYFHLIDVLMFGQPNFYSFGLNLKNWSSLNVTIIMSAVALFMYVLWTSIKYGKLKLSFTNPLSHTIYFSLMITISLFLAKGFNPPFGYLYKYVILLSPQGLVGITLDVQPWLILAALSYSFLFSVGLYYAFFRLIYEPPGDSEKKVKKTKSKPPNYFNKEYFIKSASVVIVIILLGGAITSAISGTYIKLESSTYSEYSPLYYPESYVKVTDYLESVDPNAYATWIPFNGAYSWEDNYSVKNLLSNVGGDLSQNFVNPQYLYSYLNNNGTRDLANLLTIGNIKYLIIDQSGVSPVNLSFRQLISLVEEQNDIRLVYQYSWLTIFENEMNFSVVQAIHYSQSVIANASNIEVYSVFDPHIGDVKEVSPVLYTFNYYSTNTTLILFHKAYSNMWLLSFNGNKYKPISLCNGTEMGFIVEKGYGHLTLYYELQTYYYIGAGITASFVVLSLIFKLRCKKRTHKRNPP